MPVLSRVQRSSTDDLAELMIDFERPFISLVMTSQLALENRKYFFWLLSYKLWEDVYVEHNHSMITDAWYRG